MVEYAGNDVQLAFVELPKFTKTHDKATQLWEKWLCFVKEAGSLEMVPASLAQVPQIQEAFDIANYAALSPEEAEVLDNKALWWNDQRKMHRLYERQQQSYDQVKTQLDQAQKKCDQVQTERDQVQKKCNQANEALYHTAAALQQSGFDDARICQMMKVSKQQLQQILATQTKKP